MESTNKHFLNLQKKISFAESKYDYLMINNLNIKIRFDEHLSYDEKEELISQNDEAQGVIYNAIRGGDVSPMELPAVFKCNNTIYKFYLCFLTDLALTNPEKTKNLLVKLINDINQNHWIKDKGFFDKAILSIFNIIFKVE